MAKSGRSRTEKEREWRGAHKPPPSDKYPSSPFLSVLLFLSSSCQNFHVRSVPFYPSPFITLHGCCIWYADISLLLLAVTKFQISRDVCLSPSLSLLARILGRRLVWHADISLFLQQGSNSSSPAPYVSSPSPFVAPILGRRFFFFSLLPRILRRHLIWHADISLFLQKAHKIQISRAVCPVPLPFRGSHPRVDVFAC